MSTAPGIHNRETAGPRNRAAVRQHAAFALRFLGVVDITLVALAISISAPRPMPSSIAGCFALLLIVPFWIHLFGAFGVYESNRTNGEPGVLRKVISVQIAGTVPLLVIAALGAGIDGVLFGIRFSGFSSLLLSTEKVLVYLVLPRVRRRGFDRRKVCFVGSWDEAAIQQADFGAQRDWGLEIACVGAGTLHSRKYYRYPDRTLVASTFEELLTKEVIDEVLVSARPEDIHEERFMLALCAKYGLTGRVRLIESEDVLRPSRAYYPGELTVLGSSEALGSLIWKRAMDFTIGAGAVVTLSPLLLIIALLVKLSSRGPIFFRQWRVGRNGRRFQMLKFRTMIDKAESVLHTVNQVSIAQGPFSKSPNDWRVTHVGRYLRRYSIDELPQLINVLKGEMSLVGPRPLPEIEACRITGNHRRRFSVLPGMTGLWQVNGRSDVSFADWMHYDLEYIDQWSLWLDAKLLAKTLPAVLSGRGAY